MKPATVDQMLATASYDCDVTPERARHVRGYPHGILFEDYELAPGFSRRWECGDRGRRLVWANEPELTVVEVFTELVVHEYPRGDDQVIEIGKVAIEVWADRDRFHDRLDELAGLEAVA